MKIMVSFGPSILPSANSNNGDNGDTGSLDFCNLDGFSKYLPWPLSLRNLSRLEHHIVVVQTVKKCTFNFKFHIHLSGIEVLA